MWISVCGGGVLSSGSYQKHRQTIFLNSLTLTILLLVFVYIWAVLICHQGQSDEVIADLRNDFRIFKFRLSKNH